MILEIFGAAYLVMGAFKNRGKVKLVQNTWDGLGHLTDLKDVIIGQAKSELYGFGLLGIGLGFQLIGGFGF